MYIVQYWHKTRAPSCESSSMSMVLVGRPLHDFCTFDTTFSQYTRGRGYRDWRTRGDPTLINSLWRSRQPLGIRKQLGNAEVYIVLALLIGVVTVVVGCWLSDNCWSPEPEDLLAGG
ncbi:uncharacterized protein LOC121732545 isoform X2 [Aricia agestis]|uniref:uncharacterized protein LOC121732545 isoform X2 n=1 Tax=Aricia agestis TaxID=91739 RepID=UPI001C20B48E|nr:uncharacterized protein LOC121732545 isoform X2 [Aricia agestis]